MTRILKVRGTDSRCSVPSTRLYVCTQRKPLSWSKVITLDSIMMLVYPIGQIRWLTHENESYTNLDEAFADNASHVCHRCVRAHAAQHGSECLGLSCVRSSKSYLAMIEYCQRAWRENADCAVYSIFLDDFAARVLWIDQHVN